MSGNNIVADTNVLIYFLGGNIKFENLLSDYTVYVSFINEMEVLSSSVFTDEIYLNTKIFLENECHLIEMNDFIKEKAIEYRRKHKLKLPDAIVAATASFLQIPIITADIAFRRIEDLQVILVKP